VPFKQLQSKKHPPRQWTLVGYPDSGKSTLAARMRDPILVIDADNRFAEVTHLAKTVYALSDTPNDNTNADAIASILAKQMPGSAIGTVVVDSLTAIITPLVTQAMVDKDAGREKNLVAAFRGKALAMRQLQDAITRWGTDVLWIYHKHDSRDAKANQQTRATIPATELIRLTRSINAQLEIVIDEHDRRGIKIAWSRTGRDGMTLWDETGDKWIGMPERIEHEMYDGLSEDEQRQKETAAPEFFPSVEVAIAWAMEQGAFDDIQHARNAYEKIKREMNPQNARAMASFWIADAQSRLHDKVTR